MKHFLLFTGHMIDAKDRAKPRFPADKEKAIRKKIYQHLLQQKNKHNNLEGIASGACGGDILFHECCTELNIPTQVYLAMPADEFKKNSVSFANKDWDKRFDELIIKKPAHVLPVDQTITMNVYEQTNEWMLQAALSSGGANMILMALWDGGGGDDKGGTEHMIKIAKKEEAEVDVIDIKKV